MRNFLFVSFTILFFILSCKKKEVALADVEITVLSPFEGVQYQVFDTITVKGEVVATGTISSITIAVNNEKNVKVLPSVTWSTTGSVVHFHKQLVISAIHLTSGTYFLAVTAKVGEEIKTVYRQLFIHSLPLQRSAILVASSIGTSSEIATLDSNANFTRLIGLEGDVSKMEVNAYDQQLHLVGEKNGALRILDLNTLETTWKQDHLAGVGDPYFSAVELAGRSVFYGDRNGELKGINHSGVGIFDAQVLSGRTVELMLGNEVEVVSVERELTSEKRTLVVRYTSSGVERQRIELKNKVIALLPLKDEHFLVVEEGRSGTVFRNYQLDGNFFDFRERRIDGVIIEQVQAVSDRQFLCLSSGQFFTFDAEMFTQQPLITTSAEGFAYDALNAELWTYHGEEIEVYGYPDGALISSFQHKQNIGAIAIGYNR